ncbi:MAG: metal ABC transporter substrate-binding protein [Candidatus Heimdallarchaeota archaeon]|nr:metal ABC transporter substrate-binding protein [Candidatus Heimdallarchaeota archaeon]MDH5646483.1 metal ABC transporter substrate-binding protein [Candidatus Heimdallarchaeota archaeon]
MRWNTTRLIVILCIISHNPILAESNIQPTQNGQVQIVTTLSFLGDMVYSILGDNVAIYNIIDGSVDPHFYEPTSEAIIKLDESDFIIALGSPEFDEWLIQYIENSGSINLLEKLYYVIDVSEVEQIDPITNSPNPHIWLSPVIGKLMIENLFNIFVSLDLFDYSNMQTNKNVINNQLDEYISEMNELKAYYIGTKVVVDHPAFMYFLNLLGFIRVAAIEEKEGIEPSAHHIDEITNRMIEEEITLIIATKNQENPDVLQLARNTNSNIVYLHILPGAENVESYVKLLEFNINSIQNPVPPPEEDSLNFSLIPLVIFFAIYNLIKIKNKKKIQIVS